MPLLPQMQRLQELAGLAPASSTPEADSAFQSTPRDEGDDSAGAEDEDEQILQEVLRLSRMEFENDVTSATTTEVLLPNHSVLSSRFPHRWS